MNFLSPLSLLLLLPIGAVIVILYLLKLKRREQMVSSVMLWQDAVADIQANAPFQKLKKNLLLLLQLLVALALILAVARPYMRSKGTRENKIVIVIDSSASMQSVDVSGSRFDAAKSKAQDIVRRMGPGDTALIISAGAKSRVEASFTSDKRLLAGAISGIKSGDSYSNMRQAMLLALSLVAGRSAVPPRVVVLSDGGFPELSDMTAKGAVIDFIRIGKRSDNVAITGLSSRRTLSGEQQVFIGLRNFSERERTCNLEILLNDKLLDVREEKLPAGASREEILSGVDNLDGRITAHLDISDDLAVDNIGWVYLSNTKKLSVLMVSKGNVFLQNALNLDSRVQLVRAETTPDLKTASYDLVVFDGVRPPGSLPRGGYLLINTESGQGPAEMGQTVERPVIIDTPHSHPVTAYIDFNGIAISKAHLLKPRDWASGLVEGADGYLAVAGPKDGRRFVQVSFDLLESDFPLRVGFPIFIANCLDWLAPTDAGSPGESIRTGHTASIDVPPSIAKITVQTPDGRKQDVDVIRTPVIYDDTERAGIYRVKGKGFSREFACNLCSSEESNTRPKSSILIGEKKVTAEAGTINTNREFYGPLVFLALVVLMFEWYAYHRRL